MLLKVYSYISKNMIELFLVQIVKILLIFELQ